MLPVNANCHRSINSSKLSPADLVGRGKAVTLGQVAANWIVAKTEVRISGKRSRGMGKPQVAEAGLIVSKPEGEREANEEAGQPGSKWN